MYMTAITFFRTHLKLLLRVNKKCHQMVDQIEKWKKEEQRELQTEAYHIAQRIKNVLAQSIFFRDRECEEF